jgi:hypothetical protein
VRSNAAQVGRGHGAQPSTQPVRLEIQLADSAWNPNGTGPDGTCAAAGGADDGRGAGILGGGGVDTALPDGDADGERDADSAAPWCPPQPATAKPTTARRASVRVTSVQTP